MALTSPRFARNQRLQAAAENKPALKAFDPDKDAVGLVQQALRDLRDPAIGTLPVSFRTGIADGIYGAETVEAVKQFQRQKKLSPDGAAGHDTLHALDALFQAKVPASPSPPPSEPPPTEEEVRMFLNGRLRRDVVSVLVEHAANMIVLAEVHVGKREKALLLRDVINALARRRPTGALFHASEQIQERHRVSINRFLHASPRQRALLGLLLDPEIFPFHPVFSAAAEFPEHRYAILAAGSTVRGDSPEGADSRHATIFEAFERSVHLHNVENRHHITSRSARGNFLIGAFHAARHHASGRSVKTTTERLIDAGWRVHVIRVVVDLPNIIPKDTDVLRPLAGSEPASDLLDVMRSAGSGKQFIAEITGSGSPFARLRAAPGVRRAYNELFDAVMYLPRGQP